jgi:hypothetical protein
VAGMAALGRILLQHGVPHFAPDHTVLGGVQAPATRSCAVCCRDGHYRDGRRVVRFVKNIISLRIAEFVRIIWV